MIPAFPWRELVRIVVITDKISQIRSYDQANVGLGITTKWLHYGLDDRGLIPGRGGDGTLSVHHRVQTGSVAHPDSYPMDTGGGHFPNGKADHSPPFSAEI
jgi:hypothetical protein